VVPCAEEAVEATTVIDGGGAWVTPPYVEPHVHLDASLTAGQPRWNQSGTLWEGIACWSERKPMLTREDVIDRATQTLQWDAANGTLHVRSHVDVTDPSLVALDALIEVRERVRDVVNLQLVAFPQEGICSFPDGEELLTEAARRGVDVIGAIPHFDDTREDGVRSVEFAVDLADRHGLLVDAHCDEIEEAFRMVTSRAAAVLGLGTEYGVHIGRPASFLLLPATDGYDAVRRQVRPTHVVSHGRVVATTPLVSTTLHWPGEDPGEVTFTPR
jgi:cytosine/adenosine deaminase-related metal-dependent hydrolase